MSSLTSIFDIRAVSSYEPKDLPTSSWSGYVKYTDLIGIEIEVENVVMNLAPNRVWMEKGDGSLRNDGLEFVTHPIEARHAPDSLSNLMTAALSRDACHFSPRTSVHVHLNMQDFDTEQIIDFLIIYSIFERLLYRFTARGRMKNIYCVPVTETNLLKYYVTHGVARREWSKYTGLNLACLRQFGTVEFRHMHGTFDVEKLCKWINLICSIKEYVRNTPTKEIRSMMFQMNDSFDFEGLMNKVFGEHARHLKLKNLSDVRMPYMQAKSVCLKSSTFIKILGAVSAESPFIKGFK
jgi:hypothetical protein